MRNTCDSTINYYLSICIIVLRLDPKENTMSKEYKPKYDVSQSMPHYPGKRGRKPQPKTWQRDRYYAWLKHRAQAHFRGETYSLSEQDWNEIWPKHLWMQRGRKSHELTLYRLDATGPWQLDNTTVIQNRDKGKLFHPDRKPGGRPRKHD